MNLSDPAKILLENIRQHPAFPELLRSIPRPVLTGYRPSEDLQMLGAKTAFQSGKREQHDQWLRLLTGKVPTEDK